MLAFPTLIDKRYSASIAGSLAEQVYCLAIMLWTELRESSATSCMLSFAFAVPGTATAMYGQSVRKLGVRHPASSGQ
jgi:hypothetical protein